MTIINYAQLGMRHKDEPTRDKAFEKILAAGQRAAKVPLLHVFGDADDVVPWDENTGVIAERYQKLGGSITLIRKPGIGHHPPDEPMVRMLVHFERRNHAGANTVGM